MWYYYTIIFQISKRQVSITVTHFSCISSIDYKKIKYIYCRIGLFNLSVMKWEISKLPELVRETFTFLFCH
jgi:hypothetical protein